MPSRRPMRCQPRGRGKSQRTIPIDEEMAEIEALLKSRGIVTELPSSQKAAVACPELVHRSRRKPAVHRLNTHQLTLLSIEVGLERPAVRGHHQQQGPRIAWTQDDLVDATPRHRTRSPLRIRRPVASART